MSGVSFSRTFFRIFLFYFFFFVALDLKNGNGSVSKGSSGKADCTLTMAEDVFEKLIAGSLNAQQAFMQGKLKIGGNMAHAMKLGPILEGLKGGMSKL